MTIKQKVQKLKRELILKEATKLFKEHGYEEMKVADLAKNVGASVGFIYTMFGTKENLYNNYILEQLEHYLQLIDNEISALEDPYEMLKVLAQIRFNAYVENEVSLRKLGINYPLFFINISDADDDVMIKFYNYMDEKIMQPLKGQIDTSKTSMEMTFLFDGLGIGMIKHWIITKGNLIAKADELIENFLLIVENR